MLCLSGFELYPRWVPLFYLIIAGSIVTGLEENNV